MKKVDKSKKERLWSNKNQVIMLVSIIVGILICTLIFSILGVKMSENSNNTIDDAGETYMRSMGIQITRRFESVMTQRISMVQALVDDEALATREELKNSAKLRGFKFLALYSVDDLNDLENGSTVDPILGEDVEVIDKLPFRRSVLAKEIKIAVGSGVTEDGSSDNAVVIISIPTDQYEMTNGNKSMSMIAGVTNKDFIDMLNFNEDSGQNESIYSYIVRKDDSADGKNSNSFVLRRSSDIQYDYLSELLRANIKSADVDPEVIIAELNAKMAENKVYSNILHVNGHHIHMFCNRLEKSEWYMVTMMDNNHLDTVIEDLSSQWTQMIIIVIVIIVSILTVIFILYLCINRRNIQQLKIARAAALDANKAKSEFLSNMSHDIRTPMNAIVGMTAIARANIDDKPQVSECLKKIAISSKHLLGLINDVLDMSKIESGKMTLNVEQVSLREVLDSITTIVQPQVKIKRQKFNINVQNIIQENVLCDSVRLNQVLLNLLSNAIKFTGEEGTIEFSLYQEESPVDERFVRTHIIVKDNGIGMSPEFQQKIFDSFAREDNLRVHRTEGTGLGMAITKYIVDQMKGTIELKSELGKGTEFHVTIDFERAIVSEEEMVLPSWHMLVVDDEQQLCEATSVSLKELGVNSEWTLDGESAVEKVVKAHDDGNDYNVIMMDWKLPGIDGIETAKQIRKRLNNTDIPILLISAYDWTEIKDRAFAAGICGFISKPLFKSVLFYGLKKYVEGVESVPKDDKSQIDLSGTHVLLAEDNELNWEIAEAFLDGVGITCDHAENGQICVDMLKNAPAGTYKAVLMDIRMPVMNGYEATQAIRKLDHADKDIPIIAMTADAFSDDIKKCLDCGMNGHIAKPIEIETVQSMLAKFIKK